MKDADLAAQEQCTKLLVLTAAKKRKFRSSQLRGGQSIVEIAIKNIGDINPI